MTQLADAAKRLNEAAAACGNDFNKMTAAELFDYVTVVNAAAVGMSAYLVERCGSSIPRAENLIRMAMRLPKYRRDRRVRQFEKRMYLDEQPNRPQIAAWVANLIVVSDTLSAQLESRHATHS